MNGGEGIELLNGLDFKLAHALDGEAGQVGEVESFSGVEACEADREDISEIVDDALEFGFVVEGHWSSDPFSASVHSTAGDVALSK